MAERGQAPLSYTLDATVAGAWFLPGEEFDRQAIRVRDDYAAGRVTLYAPALLVFEVLNSLWKAVHRKRMKPEDGFKAASAFESLAPEVVSLRPGNLSQILQVAEAERMTAYDASYVVAAQETGSVLLSSDPLLLERAGKYVRVRHVKDYP